MFSNNNNSIYKAPKALASEALCSYVMATINVVWNYFKEVGNK